MGQACIEEIDYHHQRGFNQEVMATRANEQWLLKSNEERQAIYIYAKHSLTNKDSRLLYNTCLDPLFSYSYPVFLDRNMIQLK